MPDLSFKVEEAVAVPFAAAPTLAFKLRIANAIPGESIHTVALRCQIQIETTRRRYSAEEQMGMLDLFGEPERWSHTLRRLLWTHVSVVVPAFEDNTLAEIPALPVFHSGGAIGIEHVALVEYGLSDLLHFIEVHEPTVSATGNILSNILFRACSHVGIPFCVLN